MRDHTSSKVPSVTQDDRAPDSQVVPTPHPSRRGQGGPASAPAAEPETGATQIVRALCGAGVDTFFGVAGGPVMALFDAVLREPAARLVESRHETHAVFAAMGFWRATGKVPAVVVTAGQGATSAITGIVSAHAERVPMLIICGDVAWAASGGRLLQPLGPEGVGIDEMVKNVTRAAVRVALTRSAASQALAALGKAASPSNPGPALLVVPNDCAAQSSPPAQVESIRSSVVSHVEDHVVLDVADQLATARRPLVVVGAGCRRHADEVQLMIEALRLPFMTTPRAKGVLGEEHPYALRNGGAGASWWARRYTAGGPDVALALGTDLDDVSVGQTPPIRPQGNLIHVDLDASVFHRNIPAKTAIVCDVGAFARSLCEAALTFGLRSACSRQLLAEARAQSAFDRPQFRTDESPRLAPHRAIHDLESAAGPDATFVTDVGEHMLFALHYLTAPGPRSFVAHVGLGSVASGICSAIGHAIGDRTRRVVCICGDGSMQLAGSELLVAAKLELPIVYAVFNVGRDSAFAGPFHGARYDVIHRGYRQPAGGEGAWDAPCVDFVTWARAFGLPGVRIERPGQITAELLRKLTERGLPVVLDIRYDTEVRLQGGGRGEALQQAPSAPKAGAVAAVPTRRAAAAPATSRATGGGRDEAARQGSSPRVEAPPPAEPMPRPADAARRETRSGAPPPACPPTMPPPPPLAPQPAPTSEAGAATSENGPVTVRSRTF